VHYRRKLLVWVPKKGQLYSRTPKNGANWLITAHFERREAKQERGVARQDTSELQEY
jgi:hypothetical protein